MGNPELCVDSYTPISESPAGARYPVAALGVTNRCTLRCEHCFVFRGRNPNLPGNEPTDEEILEPVEAARDKYGIQQMIWAGGEPMLRKKLLRKGLGLFERNTINTNGTLPLTDFSDVTDNLLYVVSLDGPEQVNDIIRGKGVYKRVIETVSRVPEDFPHTVQCQCCVTKKNEDFLEEFTEAMQASRFDHLTFTFHVPARNDTTGNAWNDLRERDGAVRTVLGLRESAGGFVKNRRRSLEMMLSENAPRTVTDNCPALKHLLPMYLRDETLMRPFCCYGNDVSCDMCGAWVVFEMAALAEG